PVGAPPVAAPVGALPARGAVLPVPATRLLGREGDVGRVAALLTGGARLVTLTGTGGVGKTRLSLAVAAQVAPHFPGGAALVALATLQDPAAVMVRVAQTLGLTAVDDAGALDAVAAHLRPLRALLVLDNAEHLLDAAAEIGRLVSTCPDLAVLVTSRAPLRVRGEQEVVVEPLAVPAPSSPLAELAAAPAVQLFVERAAAVAPGFGVHEGNAAAVAAICTRLAGIPLALELAAARIRMVDPGTLLARLDEALSSGPRDLPARQRTMYATLDWSYRLLEEDAQRLFRRLGVFTGGWTLPVLERFAGRGVLGPLEALVEQSLVTVDRTGREARYAMLEPVAQHARRLLGEQERAEAVRVHAAAFLELAERARPGYQGADQVGWLHRIDAEHANLLAAVEGSVAAGDRTTAGRLTWALWLYWWFRGHFAVGRRVAAAAADGSDAPPRVRARAQLALAAMAFGQGDALVSGAVWQQALASAREAGDVEAQAHAVAGLGIVALSAGDARAAQRHHREAIALADTLGGAGDAPWILSLNHVWLGTALLRAGDRAGAREHFEAGLALARARGDRLATFVALFNLSQVELGSDDRAAHEHLREGIALSVQVADLANLAYFLEALAVVESRPGGAGERDPRRVATVLGAAQALREVVGSDVYTYYLPDGSMVRRVREAVRRALGATGFEEAAAAGRALTPEEVGQLVLSA
ncbi:ATP-binding protein, partial [Kineococcus glutinatus]|uniref:ATP-binding protein n=1 Tax=Kineococcus glutinatus TaxID=1070872 RepID=UPI0031E7BD85